MPKKTTKATKKSAGALDFETIKTNATALADDLGTRDSEFEKYEKVYLLDPDNAMGKSKRTDAKLLYDTHPHDVINSIVRMYTANEPSISVPTPSIDDAGLDTKIIEERKKLRDGANKAERFLHALLYRMMDVSQRDPVAELLRAFALFDESSIVVNNLVAFDPEGELPFAFTVPHPIQCYPRYSSARGLIQHLFKVELSYADIRATYGEDATAGLTADDAEMTVVFDYTDRNVRAVWTEDDPEPIVLEEHKLDFLPRVSMIASANGFFVAEEKKRVPFLYGILKSGLWASRNLNLTLMNDNLAKYLNSPIIEETQKGEALGIDFEQPFKEIPIRPGEKVYQLQKNVVPTEQINYYSLLSQMMERGTMPSTMMGAGVRGNMPAAGIAALTANGRVSTLQIANAVNRAMSKAFSVVLRWIVARGDEVSVWGQGGLESLAPSDLMFNGKPYTHVEFKIKPDQQQEKQMVAGLVSSLFNARLLGYEQAGELLENGGMVKSANDWMKDIIMRSMIDAQLPELAKGASEQARALTGIVQAVPSAQGAPNLGGPNAQAELQQQMQQNPQGASMGAPGGAPPGAEQIMQAMGGNLPGQGQ
jgi:hypothetical protein